MENKKIMIPVILGVILLCGIVFTVVYKKTSSSSSKGTEVETLAPKESKQVETKAVEENQSSLSDFDVNKALENKETETMLELREEDFIEDFEENKEKYGIIDESDLLIDSEMSSNGETIEEYTLSEEQKIAATSEISEEMNKALEKSVNDYTMKQAEDLLKEIKDANGGEIPWQD